MTERTAEEWAKWCDGYDGLEESPVDHHHDLTDLAAFLRDLCVERANKIIAGLEYTDYEGWWSDDEDELKAYQEKLKTNLPGNTGKTKPIGGNRCDD